MKRSVKYILLVVLALCLIGAVIYHLPVRVEKTVNMINDDGETVELRADISFQRSLIRPTVLKGTIMLDGMKYCDWESVVNSFPGEYSSSYTWWDALLDKWSGVGVQARFAYGDSKDVNEALSHQIMLFEIGPGFSLDKIEMMFLDGNADESGHVIGVHYRVVTE